MQQIREPSPPETTVGEIVARVERLPVSWWHVKTRIIVGVATFFDAFDALAIASVLPVLVPMWKLTPPQIGLLISVGFFGQLIGAIFLGWIAEKYGRMTGMIWSIATFAVMSFVCAFAWNYESFLVLRFLQGVGLGGEVPIAAVYISELAKTECSRPFCHAVRTGLPGRHRRRERSRPVGGSDAGLAIHVRHRRDLRPSWCCSCAGCCRNRRAGLPMPGG